MTPHPRDASQASGTGVAAPTVRRIREATLWLTDRCVYDCPYCVLPSHRGPFIDPEDLIRTIDRLLPFGLEAVSLTGGDPMVHPEFTAICHLLRDRLAGVSAHVTGMLVDDPVLSALERDGRRWSWWLTLVSSDREVNDRFRARGALSHVERAARLLAARGHMVQVEITVAPPAIDHLEDTVRYAFEHLGAEQVSVGPISAVGAAVRHAELCLLDAEQLQRHSQNADRAIREWTARGYRIGREARLAARSSRCEMDWTTQGVNILPDGSINACCLLMESDTALGHLAEDLRDVLSMARWDAFNRYMRPAFETEAAASDGWSCTDCVRGYQARVKGQRPPLPWGS